MEISAGILFIKDQSVLMGHATETPKWDIPKGHVEEGESTSDAAIRECFEETGYRADKKNLLSLGKFPFSSNKEVFLFLYTGTDLPVAEQCVCSSTFEKEGRTIYEMDDFKYVPFNEIPDHAGVSLTKALRQVILNISIS